MGTRLPIYFQPDETVVQVAARLAAQGLRISPTFIRTIEAEPKPANCTLCDFLGPEQRDPFGTGDSPVMHECLARHGCPWGVK